MNERLNPMLEYSRVGAFAQPDVDPRLYQMQMPQQQMTPYDTMMQQIANYQPQYQQQDPYAGYQPMIQHQHPYAQHQSVIPAIKF